MVETKDWLLRYGIILGKRFSLKERTKFLQSAGREFAAMGYEVDTTASEVTVFKNEKRKFYNLYAGDLKHADVVFATYYDTPIKSFGLYQPKAFQMKNEAKVLRLNLLFLAIATILFVSFLYWGLFPQIQAHGWKSIWTVLTVALAFLFYYLISYLRSGIPNRVNMTRNTSSLLAIFHLANSLPKMNNKKIAFALVDGGTYSDYGLQMLKAYIKKSKTKIVFLDAVGNPGELQWFSNCAFTPSIGQVHPLPTSLRSFGDVLVTAGDFQEDAVLIKQGDTKKDTELDESQLQTVVAALKDLKL